MLCEDLVNLCVRHGQKHERCTANAKTSVVLIVTGGPTVMHTEDLQANNFLGLLNPKYHLSRTSHMSEHVRSV